MLVTITRLLLVPWGSRCLHVTDSVARMACSMEYPTVISRRPPPTVRQCEQLKATCQHAVLRRTCSSYEQKIGCYAEQTPLLYIWSDWYWSVELNFVVALQEDRRTRTYVLMNHWTSPLSIKSVQNSNRPANVGACRSSDQSWADVKFRCTTETIEQQIDRTERSVILLRTSTSEDLTWRHQNIRPAGRRSWRNGLPMNWEQVLGAPPLHCTCRTQSRWVVACYLLGVAMGKSGYCYLLL